MGQPPKANIKLYLFEPNAVEHLSETPIFVLKAHRAKHIREDICYTSSHPSITMRVSLLGLCLIIQILTGLFLAIHYCGDISLAFYSVNHISRDVNYGRFFFICLFLHVGRGLYYGSYFFIHTWIIGVVILLAVIATAFLGYVLP